MLQIENLSVQYGVVGAVRDVSLHVQQGEAVCLIGSNGAGKSSVLKGIMGLASATGSVEVDGKMLQEMPTAARIAAGLALVPEGRHVFPDLSVRENLQLGFRTGSKGDRDARLADVLAYFPKLKERLKQTAGTMSGGEQQMLAIGRAVMSGPRVLLLDEPTLGLAPVMVDRVAEVIALLRARGVSVLLAEQNLNMALAVCNRGYVIATGVVTVDGLSSALRDDPEVRRAYLGISTQKEDPVHAPYTRY